MNNTQSICGSRPRLLSLVRLAASATERLQETADVTLRPWTDTHELSDPHDLAVEIEEQGYGALFVEADFVLEETFAAAPTLRFVGVCRGDYGHVDVNAATVGGVMVAYTPRRNAEAVAELTLALMLNLLRPLTEAAAFVAAGRWRDPIAGYSDFRGTELGEQIVGVIGLGAIGRRTAALLQPFGCAVLATDPALSDAEVESFGCTPVTLDELLKRSTIVAVHCPALPETHGLIDADALAKIPAGARLIATTGEGVVDAGAVADALRQGHLVGAAFDVFETHPLPPDHPLLTAPNALLLPHIGGATDTTITRYSEMIVNDYLRFLAGERPLNLANPEVLS